MGWQFRKNWVIFQLWQFCNIIAKWGLFFGILWIMDGAMEGTGGCIFMAMMRALAIASTCPGRMNFKLIMPSSSRPSYLLKLKLKPSGAAQCAPAPPSQEVDVGILCEPCNGRGWLLCDFCQGQKTNVKARNNRIYRRCPTCRAVGYVLCSKCKVFKCVTFPNYDDGEDLVL